jgi:hypothetical protein
MTTRLQEVGVYQPNRTVHVTVARERFQMKVKEHGWTAAVGSGCYHSRTLTVNNSPRLKIACCVGLLILMGLLPEKCQGEQLDVLGLYGKRPSELTKIFPGATNAEAEKSWKADDWKGWKTVSLSFNAKKKLTSISFVPIEPLSEQGAKNILLKDFHLALPKENEVNAPALIAYRNMKGKIKTVNLSYVDWKTDKRIGEIGIFFQLGWDE